MLTYRPTDNSTGLIKETLSALTALWSTFHLTSFLLPGESAGATRLGIVGNGRSEQPSRGVTVKGELVQLDISGYDS